MSRAIRGNYLPIHKNRIASHWVLHSSLRKPWVLSVLLLAVTALIIMRPIAVRHCEQPGPWLPDLPSLPRLSTIKGGHIFEDPQLVNQVYYSLCAAQKWPLYAHKEGARPRRVYDLFLLNTEMDWLEIRLHTMAPHVDYFVIVESPYTFTNHSKPLHLEESWHRFSQFHDKIIRRTVVAPTDMNAWSREHYLRSSMLTEVFPQLEGTPQEPMIDDVLIVSDLDEIPKPVTVATLRHCSFPLRTTIWSRFYYYSFQWHHVNNDWHHPQATAYRGLDATISPEDLRMDGGSLYKNESDKGNVYNASWHCSSCFSTIKETLNKMASFSHQEWNTEQNRNQTTLMERVRNGKDLYGKDWQLYERVDPNPDVPAYVAEHSDRFGYMLNRDGKNAGFVDVSL